MTSGCQVKHKEKQFTSVSHFIQPVFIPAQQIVLNAIQHRVRLSLMGPSRKSKRPRTKAPSVEEPPNVGGSARPAEESISQDIKPVDNCCDVTNSKEDAPTPLKSVNKTESTSSKQASMCIFYIEFTDSKSQVKSKSSWYGTWPRKSTASTQVARETILADKPANGASSTDLTRFESPKKVPAIAARPPSMYLGKSKETLDITMGGTFEADNSMDKPSKASPSSTSDKTSELRPTTQDKPVVGETPAEIPTPIPAEKDIRPATSSGWLGGWLSKPVNAPSAHQDNATEACEACETSPQLPAPETIPEQTQDSSPSDQVAKDTPKEVAKPETASAPVASTSWFGLWSTAAPSTVTEAPQEQIPVQVNDNEDTIMKDAPEVASEQPTEPAKPAAGSSWAFWSTETPKKATKSAEKPEDPEAAGQLAVAGEPSQESPQPAKTTTVKDSKKTKSSKRGRPQSVEIDEATRTSAEAALAKATPSQSVAPVKTAPPNLLLPSVKSTYRLMENPSILQQIARLLSLGQHAPVKHVYLTKDPPKLKKALAIGIHGLFPAPLLRTVIGQPTGTSIRFANHASDAIRRWADKNGSTDCEIEKVALEGEGKIAERVDNLWKLLLNWIEHIRKADFVLVACHSQGVPVALMLVAKLIEFGVVTSGKIGVCAMAGVSLGPFADYKSRLFSGSAGELFEFANPESVVSKRYTDALQIAVKYGVRVTYCGSIDDQLVSMEVCTDSGYFTS